VTWVRVVAIIRNSRDPQPRPGGRGRGIEVRGRGAAFVDAPSATVGITGSLGRPCRGRAHLLCRDPEAVIGQPVYAVELVAAQPSHHHQARCPGGGDPATGAGAPSGGPARRARARRSHQGRGGEAQGEGGDTTPAQQGCAGTGKAGGEDAGHEE
jgi:hypothetical protein